MELETKHTKKIALLDHPYHGILYLDPPKWELDRCWSWGFLQNKTIYKRIDTLVPGEFQEYLLPKYQDLEYTILELFDNFYTLKRYAEVCYRGGSLYKRLPALQKFLQSDEEHRRINEEVIPKIFDELYKVLKNPKQ